MRIFNPTFGSDIEFFTQTRRSEPIPAIGMVGGTKDKPKPLGDDFYIQEDNVAVEFNIPVCRTSREFTRALMRGFDKCANALPPTIMPMQAASCVFAEEYLQSPQALEFGCEPDINAWTRSVNPRPQSKNRALRSCGGHVHIGWDNPDMETRFDLIRACDVFVSLPAMFEDLDNQRRELYGKAGAMRIKPYGVEHRVLSNYFLFNEYVAGEVIDRYQKAIEFINYGHTVLPEDNEDIVNAINNSNFDASKKLQRKYEDLYRSGGKSVKPRAKHPKF